MAPMLTFNHVLLTGPPLRSIGYLSLRWQLRAALPPNLWTWPIPPTGLVSGRRGGAIARNAPVSQGLLAQGAS